MKQSVKKAIVLSIIFVFMFAQIASAIQPYDVFIEVGNAAVDVDEQGGFVNIFTNQGPMTVNGKVYDPTEDLDTVTITLENEFESVSEQVYNLGSVNEGYRNFSADIDMGGNSTFFDSVYAEVSPGGIISPIRYLPVNDYQVEKIIYDIDAPYYLSGPDIFFDASTLFVTFEVSEEVQVENSYFTLYDDNAIIVDGAVYNSYVHKENDKYIFVIELDRSKLTDGISYKLEINSNLKDIAGNLAGGDLVKLWDILYQVPQPAFDIDYTEYQGEVNVDVELINVYEVEKILIQGSSAPVDDNNNITGDPVNFKAEFHKEFNGFESFYMFNGHFADKDVPEDYCDITEDPSGKDPFELTGIPVDKLTRNQITLTYEGTEVVFYWEPGEIDYWTHAYNIINMINENPVIDIVVGNFTGVPENLYVELVSEGNDTLAKLGYLETVTQEVSDLGVDEEAYRFSSVNGISYIDFSNEVVDENNIHVRLVYDHDGDEIAEKIQPLEDVFVDNRIVEPDAYFAGVETYIGDGQEYNVIVVEFHDRIMGEAITVNNFELWDETNQTSIMPVYAVEGEPEHELEDTGAYWNAKLYFEKASFTGDILIVKNLVDRMGHVLGETQQYIHTDTHICGNLLDKYGDPLTAIQGGYFILVPTDLDLSTINLEEDDIHHYVEHIFINGDGIFDEWVKPGTYKIFNVEYETIDDEHYHMFVDKNVDIPSMSGDNVYNFNVQLNDDNVFGTVHREEGVLYEDKLLVIGTEYLPYLDGIDIFNPVFEIFGKFVKTDNFGNFSLYLGPGEYKVLGKMMGFSYEEPEFEYVFQVSDGQIFEFGNEIIFPEINVVGNILDSDGSPFDKAHVAIIGPYDDFHDTFTDENGYFGLSLDDGAYQLVAVSLISFKDDASNDNGGMYFIGHPFEVVNGAVNEVEGQNPLQDIQVPAPNLELRIVQNGSVIDGEVGLDFTLLIEEEEIDMGAHTSTGIFEFYFPPVTCVFEDMFVYIPATDYYFDIENVNFEVIIEEGSDFTGDYAQIIDITEIKENNSNVKIFVQDEQGNPVNGCGLEIQGIDRSMCDWRKTDNNGAIYMYLEAGHYKIPGCDIDGHWNELDTDFEVTDVNTPDNKVEVIITIKAPNVNGEVRDKEGNVVPHAWIDMERLPAEGEIFSEYMGFGTNENGQFSIFLDEGEYLVKSINFWNEVEQEHEWQELNFKFYVVKNGEVLEVRLTPDGEAVENLIIQKPADNLTGHVYKTYNSETGEGTTFDGSYPFDGEGDDFNHVWLALREYGITDEQFNEAPWLYETWIHVEEDGSFSTFIGESKIYEAFAIATPRKYMELNPNNESPILIQDYPVENIIIVPPVPNFGGQLLDINGNPTPNAFINVEKADYTQWTGTETDEQGCFGLSLAKGEEYIIRDVFYKTGEGETKENRIAFNKRIVVGENTGNIELKPNIRGVLNIGEIQLQPYEHVGIGIREVLSEGDPEYENYVMNPWMYETWMDVNYEEGSSIGQFIGYLEEGSYNIFGVHTPYGWKQLDVEFVLDGTDGDIVEYDEINDIYVININYMPNVEGQILDKDGNVVVDAWVDIEKVMDEAEYDGMDWDNRWFGTNTDNEGRFALKLSDGDYRLRGYSTKGYWQGNEWKPGHWINVDYEFKLIDGELADENGVSLVSILIRPNVSGCVMRYDKNSEQYETVPYAWLRIKPADESGEVDHSDWHNDKWAGADENGQFTLMLQPGNYKVVEAGGHNLWMPLDINFEIDSQGGLVQAGNDYVQEGRLIIRPNQPDVAGYVKDEEGNLLANVHIAIKPIDAEDYDWSNVHWIETDRNGYFELSLGNGAWKVTEICAPELWFKVYIPFEVNEEGISSSVTGVIEEGLLQVKPPVPNLAGIIKDFEGNRMNEEAWLCIKPADADIHDWEHAYWVEYENYDGEYMFRFYLEPGQYKVAHVSSHNLHYEPMIEFTIEGDATLDTSSPYVEDGQLVIVPPEPNVTGTIFGTIDGEEQVLSFGELSIARYDSEGNQLTMDGNEIVEECHSDHDIYWHHTKWVNADETGQFELSLYPGIYKVISVCGSEIWYESFEEFEVVEGEDLGIEIHEPDPNVEITVRNTGLTDEEAWVDIETIDNNGFKHFIPVHLESSDNGDYVFNALLKAGEYTITGFGTPNYWTEIDEEFVVADICTPVNIEIDFAQETKKRVSGQILNIGQAVDEKVWVAIQQVVDGQIDAAEEKRWIQTSGNGTFTVKLEAGTIWAVTDITTSEGYIAIDEPLTYSITVTNEAEQSPNIWIIDISSL